MRSATTRSGAAASGDPAGGLRGMGRRCLVTAEGMYAAAIWDRATRTLLLARDPLGIKPRCLTEQRDGLAFGSEIPALRAIRTSPLT